MKAKLFMTMAAATMILAGCNNDENEITDSWNGEIRLTSGVTAQTRANTQATQIQEGGKSRKGTFLFYQWSLSAHFLSVRENQTSPEYRLC